MGREKAREYVNIYDRLRDIQFAVFESYAHHHGLTAKELFVLDIIWFSPDGCLQADICSRLSATKQTVSAIVRKFADRGYLTLSESADDRRSRVIKMTAEGYEHIGRIIAPAASAEIDAMNDLSQKEAELLVRITRKFSGSMERRFAAALEAQ